jgi:hypothetical protein
MEAHCVFFAVGTEFLNVIYMSFDFRGIDITAISKKYNI